MPLVPAAPRRVLRRRGPLVALMAFLAVVAAGSVLLVTRTQQVSTPVGADPSVVLPVVTAAVESLAAMSLVAAELDDPLVYYPTVLPEDWALCQEIINPPVRRATFCDGSAEPGYELIVDVVDATGPSVSGAEPVPDTVGWSMTVGEDQLDVYVPGAWSWRLRARSTGLDLDDVVAILRSVPVVGNRALFIPAYELPVLVDQFTDTQLAGLFAPEQNIQVARDRGGSFESAFIIGRSDQPDRMSLHVGEADNTDLIGVIGDLPAARLVPAAGRPMVTGGSRETVQVFWIQRGLLWSLTTRTDSELAVSTALALEDAIAALP